MSARRDDPGQDPQARAYTRWWIDEGKERERARNKAAERPPSGERFFGVVRGYDQAAAHARLTDLNLTLLREANPAPDEIAYLGMTRERFPSERFEQVKKAIRLPPGARAVAVDSGNSLRLIATGTPPGERLIELRFSLQDSSFDAWIAGEWVAERVFQRADEALREAPGFVREYLVP